jgi:hypothetical protein
LPEWTNGGARSGDRSGSATGTSMPDFDLEMPKTSPLGMAMPPGTRALDSEGRRPDGERERAGERKNLSNGVGCWGCGTNRVREPWGRTPYRSLMKFIAALFPRRPLFEDVDCSTQTWRRCFLGRHGVRDKQTEKIQLFQSAFLRAWSIPGPSALNPESQRLAVGATLRPSVSGSLSEFRNPSRSEGGSAFVRNNPFQSEPLR